jgi:hypothetical protein
MTRTSPFVDRLDRPDRLDALGDALHAAIAADVAPGARSAGGRSEQQRRPRRRLVVAAGLAVVLGVPSVAVATNALIGREDVERGLPGGTTALLGIETTCTTVREGVEFDCTLASPPNGMLEPGAWKGTVETTAAAGRITGGCRSQNGAGTRWRCYVGTEAVRQRILAPELLGQPDAGPSVG